MTAHNKLLSFYETNYEILGTWVVRPGDKVMLGDRENRTCRFCGECTPKVTFRKVAHAIPEAFGNKSIESAYECDVCNEKFGQGIENDLGNWSKPMRTFARIRGKNGVPTIKSGGNSLGWRIEYDNNGFVIKSYEEDPIFEINEADKTVTFRLKRDAYTPVAVLKAFMKIGLTLLPDEEISNFSDILAWIQEPDHSRRFADQCSVIYTFQPGPMPNDLIAAFILRRKAHVTSYPYAYLVLGYGNEVFQVHLPSRKYDIALNGQSVSIPPFPTPGSPDPAQFGPPGRKLLDFTGREIVRSEILSLVVGYEQATKATPDIGN